MKENKKSVILFRIRIYCYIVIKTCQVVAKLKFIFLNINLNIVFELARVISFYR